MSWFDHSIRTINHLPYPHHHITSHLCAAQNLLCVVVRLFFRFFGFILFCFEMCARFAFSFRFTRISLICIKSSGVWLAREKKLARKCKRPNTHTKTNQMGKNNKNEQKLFARARIIIIYFIWAHRNFIRVLLRFVFFSLVCEVKNQHNIGIMVLSFLVYASIKDGFPRWLLK